MPDNPPAPRPGATRDADPAGAATPLLSPVVPPIHPPATGWLVGLAAVAFIGHMLVAANYGYFRDELYYLADGRHLQWGYVDQPLLMGALAALLRVTIGNGLVAIHLVPALAAAAIVAHNRAAGARGRRGPRAPRLWPPSPRSSR